MGKYKINVTVNLVECDSETDNSPIERVLSASVHSAKKNLA